MSRHSGGMSHEIKALEAKYIENPSIFRRLSALKSEYDGDDAS